MKKRPMVLVAIGVGVFIVGTAVVLISLRGSSKPSGTSVSAVGSSSAPVVVATKSMPAGTTGETLIEQHAVTLAKVAPSTYRADDLVSLSSLNQEALNAAVAPGQALALSDLHVAAGTLPTPPGDEAIALTLPSGASALAGYLAPGDQADVYATVTKLSSGGSGQAASMPLPCTALVANGIEVLDVSNQVTAYRTDPSANGRTVPSSITVLVAATPDQARRLAFYATSESLYLARPAKGAPAVSPNTCAALLNTPQLTPVP